MGKMVVVGTETHCSTLNLMEIILNLDEALLDEALHLTNLTTQEDLVNLALQELVRSRRKKNLLDLAGQIQFTEDFDHKILRETRNAAD
jgi:Arc/MetJ family transcription regulator